ncbi:MAG: S24 family peptidase [Bacteroidales bacterium]|nr:S24 family peptidase [Bacteroidales bacterium]
MNVKDRILEFCKEMGIPVRQFEIQCNMSNGYVSSMRKGLGSEKLENVLKAYPDLNREWLLYGEGSMLVDKESISVGVCSIPLIPIEAFAGYGSPAFDDMRVEDYYQVAEFKQADFLIRVKGNSMYPKYSSGDIIACKVVKETLFFQWNKIYAIYTRSQGVMVKRVKKSTMEGYILLVSDNEKYEPFDVPLSDIEAIALVIGVIRVE